MTYTCFEVITTMHWHPSFHIFKNFFLCVEIFYDILLNIYYTSVSYVFSGGSVGKESICNAEDLGQEDPVEKKMATHSSILAWEIPWTEEPGRPNSIISQELDMT